MSTTVYDSQARSIRAVTAHDGQAMRSIRKVFVHDGIDVREVFSGTGGTPELPAGGLSHSVYSADAGYLKVALRFTTDGLIKKVKTESAVSPWNPTTVVSDYEHWITPYPTEGVGANWFLRITPVSGFIYGPASGALHPLTQDRELYAEVSGPELMDGGVVTVHICDVNGEIRASCTLSLWAET